VSAALGGQGARIAGATAANRLRGSDRSQARLERRHLEAAERMVELLGTMKGAAMKVGQLASFLELDFVPDEFRPLYQEKLASLRDSAPPMSWKQVRGVLSEDLGEPPESVFDELSEEPVAAASIGQVHRGRLPDGREVAVKVQYPGVAEAIRADMQNAGAIVALVKAISPGLDARAIAREIRERMMEELDFEHEAQVQRLFARAYRGHPFIHVPEVMTELSRPRVLVSGWAEGIRFAEIRELPQAERDRFGEIVHRFYYGSIHHLGVFNADPHPGNYLLRDDGRVVFIDFGASKEHRGAQGGRFLQIIKAASERDADAYKSQLVELGYLKRPDGIEAERLLDTIYSLAGWYLEDREFTIDPEYVRGVMAAGADPRGGNLDVMRRAALPAEDLMLRRLEAGVVAVLGQLRATRNWHRISREWWFGDPPATKLGEADREFWERTGRSKARSRIR